MGGKNLVQKLKLGLAGLAIASSSYFNFVQAQGNSKNSVQNHDHEYYYEKGNESKNQENYNEAIENYTQSINIVKNIRKNEFESLKIDSLKELEAKYLVDRAIAFRKLFDLDNVMLDLDRVKNLKESITQKNYKPKYDNYVYEAIRIRDEGKNFYPDFKTLDELIDNSKTDIPKKQNYTKKEISEISEKIYSDIEKKLPDMKEREDIDMCYRTSMVYLAIGKENNLPLSGILVPGNHTHHMAVIWDNSKDSHDFLNHNNPINKNDFIIETTAGKIKNDQDYLSPLISKKSLEKKIYLNNLNEKDFLATAHWSRAIEEIGKEKYQEALEDCNKAIELNPNSPIAYNIRAGNYFYLEEFKKSLEDLNKAIELNPEPDFFYVRAFVLSKLEKYKQALKNYNQAINLAREYRKKEKDILEIVSLKDLEIKCLIKRSQVYENTKKNTKKSSEDMEKAKSLVKSIENNERESLAYLILKEKSRKETEYLRSSILD